MSHPPNKFPYYVTLMSSIIDAEPCSYEEVTSERVWWDAMVEEYKIMKNDDWEMLPRLGGKSMIGFK